MGQTPSQTHPTPEDVLSSFDRLATQQLSAIEEYSLKKNELTEDNFASEVGILGKTGSEVFIRSASFFASYPFSLTLDQPVAAHLPKIITLFNGKLRSVLRMSEDEWYRLLFLSIAATGTRSKELGDPGDHDAKELSRAKVDQYYIVFDDLVKLVTLLVSVYDQDPWEKKSIDPAPKDREIALRLLTPFRAPIISYDSFYRIVTLYPGLLDCFGQISDRVLFTDSTDATGKETAKPKSRPDIPHGALCQLYLSLGPKVFEMIRLFDGRQNGFSMRSFESKVFNWKAPTLLLVQGQTPHKQPHELDQLIPAVSNVKQRAAKRFMYAVVLQTPWKVSTKHTFANRDTSMIQLMPENVIYTPEPSSDPVTAFFAPSIGVGVGLRPPQLLPVKVTKAGSVSLLLDSLFQYGSFRCLGEGGAFVSTIGPITDAFEDRFAIDNVQVWGMGTKKDLENQQQAWAWEKREANRRQNVNVGEDRAILEMAGLVGQYPTG